VKDFESGWLGSFGSSEHGRQSLSLSTFFNLTLAKQIAIS
jgi:hypothetical protein